MRKKKVARGRPLGSKNKAKKRKAKKKTATKARRKKTGTLLARGKKSKAKKAHGKKSKTKIVAKKKRASITKRRRAVRTLHPVPGQEADACEHDNGAVEPGRRVAGTA